MPDPEDMSAEAAMRELAEILAGGFLRLRGSEMKLGDIAFEIEGQAGVTDNAAKGFRAMILPR